MTSRKIGDEKLPPYIPRMMNRLTAPNSGPAPVLRFHRWIYIRSDGRIGPGMMGCWTLLLRTVGRKTGQQRTTVLNFVRDGDRIILAASNDGRDCSPDWFHNLVVNREVQVQIGRQRFDGTASVIESGDPDMPRLWELMNRTNNQRYDAYQAKTARAISLVAIVKSTNGSQRLTRSGQAGRSGLSPSSS